MDKILSLAKTRRYQLRASGTDTPRKEFYDLCPRFIRAFLFQVLYLARGETH